MLFALVVFFPVFFSGDINSHMLKKVRSILFWLQIEKSISVYSTYLVKKLIVQKLLIVQKSTHGHKGFQFHQISLGIAVWLNSEELCQLNKTAVLNIHKDSDINS